MLSDFVSNLLYLLQVVTKTAFCPGERHHLIQLAGCREVRALHSQHTQRELTGRSGLWQVASPSSGAEHSVVQASVVQDVIWPWLGFVPGWLGTSFTSYWLYIIPVFTDTYRL